MQDNNEPELSSDELSDLIAALIEAGALEILGYDSVSDQFTYKLTDKCAQIYPELYDAHFEHVGEVAKDLWMEDVIDIVFMEGQTVVGLTPEQFDFVKENINTFDEDKRLFLESVLSYYQSKE